jgi:N-formylmaleamate deformylase
MWTEHTIEANGLAIHYRRAGTGTTPLVLAHGATDNGGCWGVVAQRLADHYAIYAPDARGHGQTSAPEGDYSSGTMAGDLAAFITTLGIERPLVMGHSMGANTTLALIAGWPNIARAAVLEDPVFRLDVSAEHEIEARRARMRADFDRRQSETHEEIIAAGKRANPSWHDNEFDAWADAKKRVSAAFLFARPAAVPFDWRALLSAVRIPVLLVTPDVPPVDNGIVTAAAAAVAQGLCVTLEVAHVPGAGHNIRRERLEAFLAAVTPFLASHA